MPNRLDPDENALPVQITLGKAEHLALLKHAPKRSRLLRRLIATVEDDRISRKGSYVFTGFVTDGLALRAVARMHVPEALPTIERALKRAHEE